MLRAQRIIAALWHFSVALAMDNLLPQIPAIASFESSSADPFELSSDVQIIVDPIYANSSDSIHTPSLFRYATTFREDLLSLTGFSTVPDVTTGTLPSTNTTTSTIYLSLGSTNKTLYNGAPTLEGYDVDISLGVFSIQGAGALGAWWGTRTLLQQVALAMNGSKNATSISIPAGSGSDVPGWEVRGFMLDAGRHWFEASFIADLCRYASFFKINELHLHASDNLWDPAFLYGEGDAWRELYAAFRFQPSLDSSVVGLVPLRNESWSQEDFSDMQTTCLSYGINVIPEIDTPGHSLVITQWKPELMLAGNPDQLNLTYPDTIPSIKEIWTEFLPWFVSQEVHIGADEYDTDYADDYISFVNEMASFVAEANSSAQSIRIWGTAEPSNDSVVSTNITIQHWDFPSTVPVSLMSQGYSVINSEQVFLYLDGKTSDGDEFPRSLNETLMWTGAPDGSGWAPNIFSPTDALNNTTPDAPLLRGSVMALWNDWGDNATTPLEIYYQLAESIAVFAEKTWSGSGVRDSALTQEDFNTAYPILNAAVSDNNLNRVVEGVQAGSVVYQYSEIDALGVNTSVVSVGPPYTLSFVIQPFNSTNDTTLFSGQDSVLHLIDLSLVFQDPTTQVFYSATNLTLPSGSNSSIAIHATRDYTYADVGGETFFWTTLLDIWGEYMAVENMSFAAPSQYIAGNVGIQNVTLTLN